MEKLLADDIEWPCWSCDPAPLKEQRELCHRFTEALSCDTEHLSHDNETKSCDENKKQRKRRKPRRLRSPKKHKSKEVVSDEEIQVVSDDDKVLEPNPLPAGDTNMNSKRSNTSSDDDDDSKSKIRKEIHPLPFVDMVSSDTESDIIPHISSITDKVPSKSTAGSKSIRQLSIDGMLFDATGSGSDTCERRSHDKSSESHDLGGGSRPINNHCISDDDDDEGPISALRVKSSRKLDSSNSSEIESDDISLSDEENVRKRKRLSPKKKRKKPNPSSHRRNSTSCSYGNLMRCVDHSEYGIETFNNSSEEDKDHTLVNDTPTTKTMPVVEDAPSDTPTEPYTPPTKPDTPIREMSPIDGQTTPSRVKSRGLLKKKLLLNITKTREERNSSEEGKRNKENNGKSKQTNKLKITKELLECLISSDEEECNASPVSSVVLTSPSPSPLNRSMVASSISRKPKRKLSDEFLIHSELESSSDSEVRILKKTKSRNKRVRLDSSNSRSSDNDRERGPAGVRRAKQSDEDSEFETERRYSTQHLKRYKKKKRNRFSSNSSDEDNDRKSKEDSPNSEGKGKEPLSNTPSNHDVTVPHIASHHYIILHHITSYYIILHHIITSYYIMLPHIASYYIMLPHIALYYIMLPHIALYYIILHHIASCYIILHHIDKRKNIRKLISQDKLAMETREAQKAERERRDRLKKKQTENAKPDDLETDKRIILAKDSTTKKILLEVSISLCMMVYSCLCQYILVHASIFLFMSVYSCAC